MIPSLVRESGGRNTPSTLACAAAKRGLHCQPATTLPASLSKCAHAALLLFTPPHTHTHHQVCHHPHLLEEFRPDADEQAAGAGAEDAGTQTAAQAAGEGGASGVSGTAAQAPLEVLLAGSGKLQVRGWVCGLALFRGATPASSRSAPISLQLCVVFLVFGPLLQSVPCCCCSWNVRVRVQGSIAPRPRHMLTHNTCVSCGTASWSWCLQVLDKMLGQLRAAGQCVLVLSQSTKVRGFEAAGGSGTVRSKHTRGSPAPRFDAMRWHEPQSLH